MEKYIDAVINYLKTANIVFVVFDMTDNKSFETLDQWI